MDTRVLITRVLMTLILTAFSPIHSGHSGREKKQKMTLELKAHYSPINTFEKINAKWVVGSQIQI